MDKTGIKVMAFDLDGTLSQHKSHMPEKNREMLFELSKRYRILMAGAGQVERIFEQMEKFPADIIGNYGMQYGEYNRDTKSIDIKRDIKVDCDRALTEERVTLLRNKYGFSEYAGDSVEYHPSGCITFPLLGTKAKKEDKLSFDPDRAKRRAIYPDVVNTFKEYEVFVGGSSSFDMAPKPYNKYYALDIFCRENGLRHDELCFAGDDYGPGGNDESVFRSDFYFIKIDNFLDFAKIMKEFIEK